MAYQALYRKWRPHIFEDVVGQDHIVLTLKNQIVNKKIAHAYLFCGSRGTGKTSTAKIFSRAVNCERSLDGNPCNECNACKGILNGSIFDVIEIDGASNNKVDDVRNIRDEVVYAPANIKYKVYIIDEVHMLTTEAFNALLKTLEEPPEYIIFILATTEFHKIPATIISRCQKFDFKRITYKDTAKRLERVAEDDSIKVSRSAINLLAKAADGSLRDGLSKLDQCLAMGIETIEYRDVAKVIGASDPDFLAGFADTIIEERLGASLKQLDDGVNAGMDVFRLFHDVIDYFRDLMLLKTTNDMSMLINNEAEVLDRYKDQMSKLTLSRIVKITDTLFEGINYAKYTTSPKLAFEHCLLKIASKSTDGDISSLMERLEILESRLDEAARLPIPVRSDEIPLIEEEPGEIEEAPVVEPEEFQKEPVNEPGEIEEAPIVEPEELQKEPVNEPEEIEEAPIVEPEELQKEPVMEMEELQEALSDEPEEITKEPEIELIEKQVEVVAEEEQPDDGTNALIDEIVNNIKEIIMKAKNVDFGFLNIMKKAEFTNNNGILVIIFTQKTSFDIARANKYDEALKNTISRSYQAEIQVKLNLKEEGGGVPSEKDPFADVLEIAGQNEILFNIE